MSRVLLFLRVVSKNVPVLLKVMLLPQLRGVGWVKALMCDLQWLCLHPDYAACSRFDLVQWMSHFRDMPVSHTHCIRRFAASPAATMNAVCEHVVGSEFSRSSLCIDMQKCILT